MAFKLVKKFIKHSFKKDKPVAKIDSSIPLVLEANDKSTSYELNVALHQWKHTFGLATKDKMNFNADDSSSSHFIVYFSPYTLECFLNYYKTLIEQEVPLPHTGGNPFRPAVTTIYIEYNTFLRDKYTKDSKGNSRPVLDSNHVLKKFVGNKKHAFVSDKFMGILVLMNQLIFFYDYSATELANGDVDPSSEYSAAKKLAKFLRAAYLGEHRISSFNVATIPTYQQFERQQISSVYIPSLVSPDINHYAVDKTRKDQTQRDDYMAKMREKEREQTATLSPEARKLKSESDSIARASRASRAKAKINKASSASQVPHSAESSVKPESSMNSTAPSSNSQSIVNPFAGPGAQTASTVSGSVSSSSVQSQTAASQQSNVSQLNDSIGNEDSVGMARKPMKASKSNNQTGAYQQDSVVGNSLQHTSSQMHSSESTNTSRTSVVPKASDKAREEPDKHSTSQVTKTSNKQNQTDLVDAHKFAKQKFPLTDDSTVISGGIQILLDRDPNLFHIPFRFKTFKVDKDLPSPAPIQEAIRTGNVDNQRYVLESDNHYKQIVNDIINNRSNVLDMGYTRELTDLLYGAYSKLDNKISVLLSQKMNNKPLFDSARHYYNIHYGKIYRSLAQGEKTELQTVNRALFDEYMSKKRLKDNAIQQRYSSRYHDAHIKVNDLANRAMYRARQQRNRELDTQIKALTDTDIRKLHLQIEQAKIEYKHRFATVGDKLTSFFYDRIQAHHEKVLAVVSNLIRKQVKLDESKADLQQAKAEVVNSKGNRQAHAKYAHEQQKQQSYINELNNEINTDTDKLTTLQASTQKIKNKMTAALAKNRSLQSQLDNANAVVTQTKQEIAKGKSNLSEMNRVKKRNTSLAVQASAAKADYSMANSIAASNSAKASQATSASIAASHTLELEHQNNQSTVQKYRAKVHMLQAQSSAATQQAHSKALMFKNKLQQASQSFNDYKVSEASVKASNSSAASASVSEVAQSLTASAQSVITKRGNSYTAKTNNYQNRISELTEQASLAVTQHNGSAKALHEQLARTRRSLADYRASATNAQSASSSAMQSTIDSYAASASSSASVAMAQKLGNHHDIEAQYQKRIQDLQSQVHSATMTGQSSATSLNTELSHAYASLTNFKAHASSQRSSIVSSVAESMATKEEARHAEEASHGNQLKQQLADYKHKLLIAQSHKTNSQHDKLTIKALQTSLANTQQEMSNYQQTVSNSQLQQSIASASASTSASRATSSYSAALANAMANLRNASQSTDTTSATTTLKAIRSQFNSYQASVSNSNEVRSLTASQQHEHQAASYDKQVSDMRAKLQNAIKSRAKTSSQAETISALKASFKSQLNSYSKSFASYKSSVAVSNASAAQSVDASNKATKAALSSATVSNATAQKSSSNHQSVRQEPEDKGYQGPEYDFSRQQNYKPSPEPSYNPQQDEVEQQQMQQMLRLKHENQQLRKNKSNQNNKADAKKKPWWKL